MEPCLRSACSTALSVDGLLRRYDNGHEHLDGLHGREGAFLVCTFWLVDALHGVGRHAEAVKLFQRLLDLRNDVGLLSEEVDWSSGAHLGNTPQAYSLVGLVNSALRLADRATTSPRTRRTSEPRTVPADRQ